MNIDVISTVLCNLDINEYEEVVYGLPDREQKQVVQYWKIHTKYEVIIDEYDEKKWYRNGKTHRDDDLPAVERSNGYKAWYKNGKLHRDGDLPAVSWSDGSKSWWKNGNRHRDGDLPAIVQTNGAKEWWKNNKKHRDGDLPAVVWADGGIEWWKNGNLKNFAWRQLIT